MPPSRLAETSREKQAISLLIFAFAALTIVIFLFSYRTLAYAEPGGFPAFYGAAKLSRFDLSQLYNLQLQDRFHPNNQGTGYFFHLPYEALLLVPLTYFSQLQAFGLWSALNIGCLVAGAQMLKKLFPAFNVLFPLAFAPTLIMLSNGQDDAIVVVIAVVALLEFARGRDLAAGLILAIGLFKYPFVVPLVAILCVRHRRVLLGFIAASIPLLGISFALVGMQGVRQYIAMTHATDGKEQFQILSNLRGLAGIVFGAGHAGWIIALSAIIVALAALIKAPRVPLFCIAVIVTQLVSWHGHLYDAVMLMIPMAWMLNSEAKWLRWSGVLLLGAAPVMIVTPMRAYWLAVVLCALLMLLLAPPARRALFAETTAGAPLLP